MRNRIALAGMMLVAGVLFGCGKENAQVSAENAVTVAPDCPQADADGNVPLRQGLVARILQKGYGPAVRLGDRALVNAKLWVHDDSAEGGKGLFIWESDPSGFEFTLGDGGFIAGWSPGIECMLVGEHRELIIASELAYGEAGRPPVPPNASLIYDLRLVRATTPEQ